MICESENYYCDLLELQLREAGFVVSREVAFFQGVTDIVAVSDGTIIAIEVKMRDYKRGLRQARKHLLFASEVYVAMPSERARRLDWARQPNWGIGLIGIGKEVEIIFESAPEISAVQAYREQMIRTVISEHDDGY